MKYEFYFLNKQDGREIPVLDSGNLRTVLAKMMRTIWNFNVPGHEYNIIMMPWKLKANLLRIGIPFSIAERGDWLMCVQYRGKNGL